MLRRFHLPRVHDVDAVHQLHRIQHAIADLERRLGRAFAEADWAALRPPSAHHAEVAALSNALFAIEARSPDDLLRLESHLEVVDPRSDQALPRCVHCRFITEGLAPTGEVRDAEILADQRTLALKTDQKDCGKPRQGC